MPSISTIIRSLKLQSQERPDGYRKYVYDSVTGPVQVEMRQSQEPTRQWGLKMSLSVGNRSYVLKQDWARSHFAFREEIFRREGLNVYLRGLGKLLKQKPGVLSGQLGGFYFGSSWVDVSVNNAMSASDSLVALKGMVDIAAKSGAVTMSPGENGSKTLDFSNIKGVEGFSLQVIVSKVKLSDGYVYPGHSIELTGMIPTIDGKNVVHKTDVFIPEDQEIRRLSGMEDAPDFSGFDTDWDAEKLVMNVRKAVAVAANNAMKGQQADRQVDNAQVRGGIDFAQSNLDMQIRRDGKGVPLPVSQQNLDNIRINGLVPVILEIKPAANLPLFSELAASKAGASA